MTATAEPSSSASRRRVPRWVKRIVIALVAAVVLFHLAGGWYFAGQIRSTALVVKPDTITMDLQVTAYSSGRITLRETGDTERGLHVGEIYGLSWGTGFGQVSGPPSGSGKEVTRTLTVLTGSAPGVGVAAGLTRDAFPDDPKLAVAHTVQDITYRSALGDTPAWFVGGTSDVWAILVHGWTASRTEMLRAMRTTVSAGLPSLDIAYRNDLSAPRDPSGYYQYGRTEWHDLEAAVDYAQAHGARAVVLVGVSMGGGIVASFMEHSDRAHLVQALVLDAPMLSFGRAVDLAASRKSLPSTLTWTAKKIAGLRYDLDWSATNYLRNTSWDTVPTLVFHGDADTRVPLAGSRLLARSHPAQVTLDVVHGAGHVESWNVDPAGYDHMLGDFLKAHA